MLNWRPSTLVYPLSFGIGIPTNSIRNGIKPLSILLSQFPIRQTCHAIGRQGESPMAKAPPFRDLHKRYPVENLQEALGEGIATGHATMPEFKFEPKQVDEIIDYLKTLERQ